MAAKTQRDWPTNRLRKLDLESGRTVSLGAVEALRVKFEPQHDSMPTGLVTFDALNTDRLRQSRDFNSRINCDSSRSRGRGGLPPPGFGKRGKENGVTDRQQVDCANSGATAGQ